jgi:hypothetical protein
MTPPISFEERARTLTHSLLTDATRVPSRLPRERVRSAPWKAIAVFAATVLVISGAVVGVSLELRSGPSVKPIPATPATDWQSFQLPVVGSSPAAISCPDVNYCVVVDYAGHWFLSTDPGHGAWQMESEPPLTTVPSSYVMTGVSCVNRSRCVAVDQSGDVVITTNLGGSPSVGNGLLVAPKAAFTGISCPSATLCVAVGGNSPFLNPLGVVVTSNPIPGINWSFAATIDDEAGLTAISCPTVTFCVATDEVGNVITSSNPTGTIGAWHLTKVIDTNSFTSISCPTVHFCAAVDSNGEVVTSTNPTGGSDAWTTTKVDGSVRFDSVSCPSAGFCVAGGLSDFVFVSSDPTGGSGAWTRTRVISSGTAAMVALACPSTHLCVGVDDAGGAHVYTNPSR